jgi:hypothetical protein
MRGRRPLGPACVDHLAGSNQAKERLKTVLENLAGRCRTREACQHLGISEPRFQQLRQRVLVAALERMEPRPAGRPARPASPEHTRIEALEARLAEQDVELRAALAREEIALMLPRVANAASGPEKKTRGQPRTTRSRPPGTRKHT